MNNNRNPYILIGLAVVGLLVLFYYWFGGGPKFDWNESSWSRKSYKETNDQPYGTQLAHRLLKQYFPGKKFTDIYKDLATELWVDTTGQSNYVFIGEGMYLDSLSTQRLLDFVNAGNTALLMSKTIPFDLMSMHLYYSECDAEIGWDDYATREDSFMRPSLLEPALRGAQRPSVFFARQNKPESYTWSYIENRHFCDSLPQRALGYLNDSLVNFADFPYGKGHFLLLTTPIVFSNFHLLRPEVRQYAAGVLSHLKEGPVYWDGYSRVPEQVARRRNGTDRGLPEEHPLSFILKYPALAWAWYLLLGLAGAYLLFRAKRRQRIIPVLPKNENSSYEFISTIANLHFRERNYHGLCMQSMKLFLAQVRERYGLVAPISPESNLPRLDNDFVARLSRVSEVPESQVQLIFTQYSNALRYQTTEEMMVEFHLATEAFFKKAK